MIFFGHIGITTAAVKTFENIFKNKEMSIDYRLVIIGSILPDLIDKPIAFLYTKNLLHGGKLFGHTLIFSIILMITGIIRYLINKRKNILILGICCLIHSFLDLMWLFPKTYFYPFYGLELTLKLDAKNLPYYAKLYYSKNSYLLTEMLGLLIFILCVLPRDSRK